MSVGTRYDRISGLHRDRHRGQHIRVVPDLKIVLVTTENNPYALSGHFFLNATWLSFTSTSTVSLSLKDPLMSSRASGGST